MRLANGATLEHSDAPPDLIVTQRADPPAGDVPVVRSRGLFAVLLSL